MIDTDKYKGHTPAPWVWNDDWCSALIGLPNKDADIYDEDAQTVIGVDTDNTPICDSFYEYHPNLGGERGEERWGGVTLKAFPEEQLKNNALRSEDALLIAHAPLILEAYKELQNQYEELKEALIGDSPNWTHDEVVEQALELATLNHNDGDRE